MTYRNYILANRINDSAEAWKTYNEKYNSAFGHMSERMKEQHLNVTYKYRFAIQMKGDSLC